MIAATMVTGLQTLHPDGDPCCMVLDNHSVFSELLGMPSADIEPLAAAGVWF